MNFFTKLIFLAILAGIVFASYSSWKEMNRSKRIEAEVEKLRMEASRMKDENQALSDRIAYFETDAYREREAKEKLGLKNVDETAVILRPDKKTFSEEPVALSLPPKNIDAPIFKKWIYFFFPKRYNEENDKN